MLKKIQSFVYFYLWKRYSISSFSSTYKEFKSSFSGSYNKNKAEQTKNQWVFLDSSENQYHRANYHLKLWTGKVNTEPQMWSIYLEQRLLEPETSRNSKWWLWWIPGAERKEHLRPQFHTFSLVWHQLLSVKIPQKKP